MVESKYLRVCFEPGRSRSTSMVSTRESLLKRVIDRIVLRNVELAGLYLRALPYLIGDTLGWAFRMSSFLQDCQYPTGRAHEV